MAKFKRLINSKVWANFGLTQKSVKPDGADTRGGSRSTATAIDPYLWWHDSTNFRAFRPSGDGVQPRFYSFIAEGDLAKFQDFAKGLPITIPPAYLMPLRLPANPDDRLARFFTFTLEISFLRPTLFTGTQRSVDWQELRQNLTKLIACEHLDRLQLGFPRGEPQPDSRRNDNDRYGEQAAENQVLSVPTPPTSSCANANAPQATAEVVIGIVDDGAAFAHAGVLEPDGAHSRVKIVWNQTQQISNLNGAIWRRPCGADGSASWYGAVLEPAAIRDLFVHHSKHGEIDELGCYAALMSDKGAARALRSRESHGASVLAAAAGSLDATNILPLGADESQHMRPQQVNDAASRAPVIFVDLPYEQISISSGRWMSICALDGVRFIIEQARARFLPAPNAARVPVVINISSGSNAGAHDGNSMFESALTEILTADPLIAVTLAVGNSRLARCHVVETLPAGGGKVDICVRVPPAKKFETYVEIWPQWLDSAGVKAADDPDSLSMVITSPDGTTRTVLCDGVGKEFRNREHAALQGEEDAEGSHEDDAIAGVIFARNVAQSRDRPMALLVVAATAPHEEYVSAPFGNWTITVVSKSSQTVRINAWIERDETVFGVRRPQTAHFIKDGVPLGTVLDWDEDTDQSVSRQHTTSNFANADKAFAVAAGVGGRADGFVSSYSGAGGFGPYDGRPFFVARADRSPAQPGVPVWGNYRSARRHMNGTSIAAPQVARIIANAFARGNDRDHLTCLVQHSQPRTHPHLGAVAAGEGRLFVDISDTPPSECRPISNR